MDEAVLTKVLAQIPRLKIAVVGDLFLDRYLEIDPELNEPSLETGLHAYQVVNIRNQPGAAGTVINNLVSLGVGLICPVGFVGDDGEGYELCKALSAMPPLQLDLVKRVENRRTPTYTKPLFCPKAQPGREGNRLDIKNRRPLPATVEDTLIGYLQNNWEKWDAVVVLDQVSEAECGAITHRVRATLSTLAGHSPQKIVLADSRERIDLFRGMMTKPNRRECLAATGRGEDPGDLADALAQLGSITHRPIFCTMGDQGIYLFSGDKTPASLQIIPGYSVYGPLDVVGAGDSTSAGIVCALASGTSLANAAAFGNLVASITIQQIGTTGTANPEQIWQRWQEVGKSQGREGL